MREAIATAQAWRHKGIQIPIHVNVTSSTLVAHQSGKDHEWLHALRIDPTQLTVEITETERITDLPALIGFVRDNRAWGVEVASDDCGYARASLYEPWASSEEETPESSAFSTMMTRRAISS